ncbi:TetR/AcrR family transcriptional regulator [Peptostreptococcaceae bacterium AGR-M142]
MKEKIEQKALELFLKKGYKNVTLVQIAKELDITKGGIYHYFSSKEVLLFKVFDLLLDQFVGILYMEDIENKSFEYIINLFKEEIKRSKAELNIENAINNYDFLIYCTREYEELRVKMSKAYDEIENLFIRIIEKDMNNGLLKNNIDSKDLAFEFIALMEGMIVINEIYTIKDCSLRIENVANNFYNKIKA